MWAVKSKGNQWRSTKTRFDEINCNQSKTMNIQEKQWKSIAVNGNRINAKQRKLTVAVFRLPAAGLECTGAVFKVCTALYGLHLECAGAALWAHRACICCAGNDLVYTGGSIQYKGTTSRVVFGLAGAVLDHTAPAVRMRMGYICSMQGLHLECAGDTFSPQGSI